MTGGRVAGRIGFCWLRHALLGALLALQAAAAGAIEIGPLVLRRDIPPGLLGQFRVYDRTPIESSQFTIRLAHADAYAALGLKYERALSAVNISVEPTMDSGLTVLLRPLPPAIADNRPLDIVVVIFEGMKLTTRLFRVDLRSSSSEFAAIDPTETPPAAAARAAPRGAPTLPAALPASPKVAAATLPPATLPTPPGSGTATSIGPAPNVASAAPPTSAAAGSSAEASVAVMRAVERWADAWAGREVDVYAAAYVPGYRGSFASHAQWLAFRRGRIMARQLIQIDLSDIAVNVEGNRAEVRFVQRYRGDQTDLTDRKRLLMTRNATGVWLIQDESTL